MDTNDTTQTEPEVKRARNLGTIRWQEAHEDDGLTQWTDLDSQPDFDSTKAAETWIEAMAGGGIVQGGTFRLIRDVRTLTVTVETVRKVLLT